MIKAYFFYFNVFPSLFLVESHRGEPVFEAHAGKECENEYR
jgi:hypothetical protein